MGIVASRNMAEPTSRSEKGEYDMEEMRGSTSALHKKRIAASKSTE